MNFTININKLTQYKLEISLEEYQDVGIDGCLNLTENGFGECLDTLSFSYLCESSEPNYNLINQDRCEKYLELPLNSALRDSFDPNFDGPINTLIHEPSGTEDFPYDITEGNNEYNFGEPFEDLNEDGLFNPPPTEYISEHNLWRWENDINDVCNHCSELRIKGEPAINNIEFVLVSVLNNNDDTIYGNVWLDELRMTGVKKDKGQAFRLKGSIAFSDLLNINSSDF